MSPGAPSASPTKLFLPDQADCPLVLDRYQIRGVIGQGGMGTVYKGFHVNLKRFVAIKTIRVEHQERRALLERFRREMEVIGQMDHPNVVRASDAGEKNGVFYLVMEYLVGQDLWHLVKRHGRLSGADACELVRQAALGLDYIHRSLVHRDIKPSNLMLTDSGLVKVLDLGLARAGMREEHVPEITPRGFAVGTYAYIAPEQAQPGSQIDGRADIYSLGCTLFKLLTGHVPFSGAGYENSAQQILAHCRQPITAAPEWRLVPEHLQPMLCRMTAKDPAERFPNAAEVAEALAPFAAGSEPVRLLDQTGPSEVNAFALLDAQREELSRLTVPPGDTPWSTDAIADAIVRKKPPRPFWKRPAIIAGIVLATVMLASLAWILVAGTPFSRKPAESVPMPTGPRDLDVLPTKTWKPILDEMPFAIGDPDASSSWRYDPNQQRVDFQGTDFLMLQLGTTSQERFSFDCSIFQSPWTGQVGIFWGYHEDSKLKEARQEGADFAWFQIIRIGHVGNGTMALERGAGKLRHAKHGRIFLDKALKSSHTISTPLPGEKIMVVKADGDRLASALFGSDQLTKLFSLETNQALSAHPSRGALGVFTLGRTVRFSNARFIAQSIQ